MPSKPKSDSRKVNQLTTAAKLQIMQAARLLMEAEHQAVKGDLDAIQECHLQISSMLVDAYDALGKVQDICRGNGDSE